jgi:hypothetical protein
MVLRVRYPNRKYDYVSSAAIDRLITQKQIGMFYRPSEKRWIDIEHGPLRKDANTGYDGIERRNA